MNPIIFLTCLVRQIRKRNPTYIIHLTRMPGCEKKTNPLELDQVNYIYHGPFYTNPKVIAVLCNNCNPYHPADKCELMRDPQDKIKGILIEITNPNKCFPLFISNESDLKNILNRSAYRGHHKEIICCTTDFLENTVNMNQPFIGSQSYYSIFCPVKEKNNITIYFKMNSYGCSEDSAIFDSKLTTSLKYGWNIFFDCNFLDNDEWFFCSQTFHELLPVNCKKANFKMFMLYDNMNPPSLLNLCYSSLLQYNLNIALDVNQNILPPSLCTQAPPCHFFHLSPRSVYPATHCRHAIKSSPHIYLW